MKNYLSEEEIQEIEKSQVESLVAKNQNIVKCPSCGEVAEKVQGQVDYNAKDDKGQVMSPAAAIHMSRFRLRCRGCEKNFCTGCMKEHYHAGMNCEEHKRHAEAKKCRFCGNVLANQQEEVKGAAAGAFDDVCLS